MQQTQTLKKKKVPQRKPILSSQRIRKTVALSKIPLTIPSQTLGKQHEEAGLPLPPCQALLGWSPVDSPHPAQSEKAKNSIPTKLKSGKRAIEKILKSVCEVLDSPSSWRWHETNKNQQNKSCENWTMAWNIPRFQADLRVAVRQAEFALQLLWKQLTLKLWPTKMGQDMCSEPKNNNCLVEENT